MAAAKDYFNKTSDGYIPHGIITFDKEIQDHSNILNPRNGKVSIKEEGTYLIQIGGAVSFAEHARILIRINDQSIREFSSYIKTKINIINGLAIIELKKRDLLTLDNYYARSIWCTRYRPFTFQLYKL